jgi:hypothetical protein
MAPNKFEEHIKDTIEKRTMTPSSQAWAQLSQRLDAEEKQTKKPLYLWFGIAASIAALVFVSITYFKTNIAKPEVETIIVEEQSENINKFQSEEVVETNKKMEIVNTTIETQVQDKIQQTKTKLSPKHKSAVSITEQENNLDTTEQAVAKSDNQVTDAEITRLLNEVEFKSVLTELQNLKNEANSAVTNREVDSLLKMASRELFKEKIVSHTTIVTSAEVLLEAVEDELDQSFRSRIYEALKNGLKEVKLAVANRNN